MRCLPRAQIHRSRGPTSAVTSTIGQLFCSLPIPLERTATQPRAPHELSRVPSGLSQLSVTLSQIDSIPVDQPSPPPQPDSSQAATTSYLYDVSILDRCESNRCDDIHPLADSTSRPGPSSVPLPTCGALPIGPFGPYNPAPAWLMPSQMQQKTAVAEAVKEKDMYEGRQVVMVRGKYKGKSAFVQRKVNKKYRLQVEGVSWGLEFYPNMFELPKGAM